MSSATLRLLEILESGKQIKPETNYVQAWSHIFGTDDHASTLRKLGLFYQLVQAAAEEVTQLAPAQKKSVFHWKSQITDSLFSAHGSIEWRHFINRMDEHTFEYLRLHSQIASLTIQKTEIDISQLNVARSLLKEATEEITNSSISSIAKLNLIIRIRSVINAIDDFKITGDERVFDEFKATLFDLSKAKENMGEIPGKSKIREGLTIISELMSTADGAIALSAPVIKLLENFK